MQSPFGRKCHLFLNPARLPGRGTDRRSVDSCARLLRRSRYRNQQDQDHHRPFGPGRRRFRVLAGRSSGKRQQDQRFLHLQQAPGDPGLLGNACDIGIFDEKGTDLAGKGFRGWSGGFRTEFSISAGDTTPGYLPGPVGKGTWNIVLGPYQVAEQGLDYTVNVTLEYGPDGTPFKAQYPPQQIAGRGAGLVPG
ncbi:hypothetical protein [Arthrobacter sp. NA-172]|uniref:hypothetical protein n=1 Tax=Arthrobacter sp. NA-172 TaxID=3367524 RepID=UPI00375535E0